MKIGLLLPTREAVMSGRPDAGAMVELAERAEAAGFDSVWAGDSLLARPRFEPLTLLAAAAARTRRVELGTAVLVAPLRNPVLLAHSAATVDLLAQGRLILGVGFGTRTPAIQREFAAADADYERRAGRMRELMQICRLLWSGEPVTFEGRYWTLDEATLLPKPHRPGGPPLWVGGNGPTSIRIAGQHGDGYFPNSGTPELLRGAWQGVQDAAPAGRRPLLAYYATVNVGPDAALAQRDLEQFIERYYNAPFAAISKRQACCAGSADACLEWLDGFISQGVEHLVLRLASEDQATQFQRVVSELLPRLREAYR
jgi:probable F420-dependent oxidoreductase